MTMYYVTKNYTFHLKYSSFLCKKFEYDTKLTKKILPWTLTNQKKWAVTSAPENHGRDCLLLDLYLINIPKHIKLQYIKVIILVSFKIFNRENPINRINQLFTSTMLKSHLKFKNPKIKEIINKHINTCIC